MTCDILHYLQQLLGSLFDKLHNWQQLLGSFLGLIAILVGALFNAHLNRMRDDRLRAEEANSVLAALYGEIILLRNAIGCLASLVSDVEINNSQKIYQDARFVKIHALSEPILYKQLAPKLGLIEPSIIIAIAEFYCNYEDARHNFSHLPEPVMYMNDMKLMYNGSVVLTPCCKAIKNFEETLRKIEKKLSFKPADIIDLDQANDVLNKEE